MAPAIVDQVAKRVLRAAPVVAVAELGALRRVDLAVSAAWTPGGKVQAWMGGTTLRTFTPFGWTDETVSLLVHRAGGGGPVSAWVDGLAAGSTVHLLGPRRSLVLTDLPAPPVFVGDETSIALAAAWGRPAATHVFEVNDPADVQPALTDLGLDPATVVERQPGDAHHDQLITATIDALRTDPAPPLVLTGKAQTIRAIRGALKGAGLTPTTRVKAYWDPRRSGLD